MITLENLNGFGTHNKMVTYVSTFHPVFKQRGGMKFIPGDLTDIVDIEVMENGAVRIFAYPHNNKPRIEAIYNVNQTMIERFAQQHVKATNQRIFTAKLSESKIDVITEADFTSYYAHRELRTEMFIFNVPQENGGFPHIFVMSRDSRIGPYGKCFPVFACTSHDMIDPIGKQTTFGKEITFLLYNSWNSGRFEPEVPELKDIDFPSRGSGKVQNFLNSVSLMELGDRLGTENTKKSKDIVPIEVIEPDDVIEDAGDLQEKKITKNPFGDVDKRALRDWIKVGIETTCAVNLTDVWTYGIQQTLELVQNPERQIYVSVDAPCPVKRMCLYMGKLHYIPTREFRLEDIFGQDTDEDLFMLCTDESFPSFGKVH